MRLATSLREDLTAETARCANGPDAPDVAAACFILALPAAFVTMAEGEHGDCYGWVHWAISPEHVFDARMNTGDYALPPYPGASTGLNAIAELYLVDWVRTAYMLARKFGGMDELARLFLDYSFGRTLVAIGEGDPAGVEALVAMVSWATKDGHPKAKLLAEAALDIFELKTMAPRQQVILGISFVTAAAQWTENTPQQWAQRLLDEHRNDLGEHELVQLLAVVITSSTKWAALRDELLLEIRKLADSYKRRATSKLSASRSLEARVDILQPLIFNLTNFGSTEDIMDVLWAWYGTEDAERGDANILFVGAAHGGGVTYVWPSGRWTRPGPVVAETLQGMMDGISAALTDYFRGPEGDRQLKLDERMVGAPAFEQVEQLRAAMQAHYDIPALTAQLPTDFRPRSIIVLPALRDPFQALLFDQVGWIAPMEASLSKAQAMRPIHTVSIWPGATHLTEAEVECVQNVGVAAGWKVKFAVGPLDEAAFLRFYEDAEPDLLWVIGHGEQSPYRLEETGIVLEGNVLLPITRIAAMTVPGGERRLLVLNVCSSGAAQHRGGIARIGLGHYLATPNQTVAAHLWPIDYYAALAFGCSLSLSLAKAPLPQAFGEAIATMHNQRALLVSLAELEATKAVDRLSSERLNEHLANLLNWGCPVLLT